MPSYRVVLALTAEGPETPTAEIQPSALSYEYGLNKAGVARVSVPRRAGRSTINRATLEPWRTAMWIYRDGQVVWAGIVTSVSGGSGDIEINASEFAVYLEHVKLTVNTLVPGESILLAGQLVDFATTSVSRPVGAIEVYTWQVHPADAVGFAYSPLWYEYENRMVLDLIRELQRVGQHTIVAGGVASSTQEGFEFTQTFVPRDATTGEPTKPCFTMWAPRAGQETAFAFEWGTGTRQSIYKVQSWNLSADSMANSLWVLGIGTGPQQQRANVTLPDALTTERYPLKEDIYQDPYARTNQDAQAVGRGRIAIVGKPQVKVRASIIADGRWLSYGALAVGDRVTCRIVDHDFEVVNDRLRVQSLTYSIEAGTEVATVDLINYVPFIPTPGSFLP